MNMITIMPIRSSSGGKHNNKNRGNKTIIETSAATVMENPDKESRRTLELTDSYDLIVIGLGPAGSFAAKSASNEGLSVLAIDKREKIGTPVDCGEFYPASTEMSSLMPNVEDYSLLDIPDKFIANKTTQTALIAPSGTVHSSPFEGGVLHRDKWLQHVVAEAKQAGAEVWSASRAISINGNHVRILKGGEELEVQAKIIIGADGTASRVARWADFPRLLDSQDVCPVKQYRMRNIDIDPKVVEMYLGQDYAPGAYAWELDLDGIIYAPGIPCLQFWSGL
jgi:flavin-dependent dehydrogenase